jgi:hypothetical protein
MNKVGSSSDDVDRIDDGEDRHVHRKHGSDGSYTYEPTLQYIIPTSAPQPFNPISCPLSPVHLRPDFESCHRELFLKALEFYHKCQYDKASDIVDKYLTQEEFTCRRIIIQSPKPHNPLAKTLHLDRSQ